MQVLSKAPEYALPVLRVGLSLVILWFGANQLINPDAWTTWVPAWATVFVDAKTIVYLNGGFEVVAGLLLLFGLFVSWVALFLFLHLLLIIFEIGMTPTGVRDVGIAVGLLALAMFTYKPSSAA